MKRIIPIIAVVAAASLWWFYQGGAEAPSGRPSFGGPVTVVTEVAASAPLVSTVEALGTASANESVTLTSSITETVRRINFDDGDYVAKGTVLIELTDTEEEAQLAEARANLRDLDNKLQRLLDLGDRGVASESEVDAAQAEADAARARLESVLARVEDRLIRAPFGGLLGFREISEGTLLMPGDVVTTIDDVASIKLDFTVPETVLAMMTPGRKIYAKSVAWPGRKFEGTVTAIGSRVDPVTRAVSVRAVVSNDDRALRPGMLLTVQVVTDERLGISMPERSVVQIADSAYVYVVDADRTAIRTAVELGLRQDGAVEIVNGLQDGDVVVTEGVVKMRDGATVQYANEVVSQAPVDMTSGASEQAPEDE